ncbi:MAG: helix-turn-helix domain-containing protein [Amphiplicatus sp.]
MSEAPSRKRDREATIRRIVEAMKTVLARDGAEAVGVNAVAREASVDKQLIYRYFGGLDGLVEQAGGAIDFWLAPPDKAPEKASEIPQSYGAGVAGLMRTYLAELRRNPSAQRVLAAELSGANPALKALSAARAKAVGRWLAGLRGRTGNPPPGVDAPALNAILLAAIDHLALHEASTGAFAGLDLRKPETWARLEKALTDATALLDRPRGL